MCFVSHCWSFLQMFMLSKIGLTTQECLMTNTLKINKVVNILRLLIIFWRNMLSLFQTNWIFLPNLNETTIGLWFGTKFEDLLFSPLEKGATLLYDESKSVSHKCKLCLNYIVCSWEGGLTERRGPQKNCWFKVSDGFLKMIYVFTSHIVYIRVPQSLPE